jgi:hypothetical protein
MRLKHYLALLGLCAVAPGCAPLKQVAEVVFCEPAAYCMGMDDYISRCRNRHLAEEAWGHFQGALGDCQYSDDFADGFKTGFADYLYAGGNGDPPVVPPRVYWRPTYATPQGQAMMQDWFRGYRHGTAVAKESGYREADLVPASAVLPPVLEPTSPSANRAPAMPRADEELPPPRPLPAPKVLQGPKQLPATPAVSKAAGYSFAGEQRLRPIESGPDLAPILPTRISAPSWPAPASAVPALPPSPSDVSVPPPLPVGGLH